MSNLEVALAIVAVLEAGYIVFQNYVLVGQIRYAASERRGLEDKLLAVCNPQALTHVESMSKGETGTINYMDDEAMVEVERRIGNRATQT